MTVGRAGGDVRHLRHMGTKQTGNTRSDRASILHESMRELDPDATTIHARINPNIVLADTPLNVAMVNDGDGGFRHPASTAEVLDYGDARIGNVYRKWNPRSFETTLIVVHLPKTLCDEVPAFYPVLDKDTGEPVLDAEGKPKMRSRWVARDRDEALGYFNAVLDYYGGNVLTGGQAAIHGYDINFDESTPHIQIMADTLAPDPKHEGNLRVEASQMWGAHRDVTVDKVDEKTGEAVVDPESGEPFQVMEQPKAKMSRYQRGLREHMYALGFDVELDFDPERHLSGLGKDEYGEVKDAENTAYDLRNKVAAREVNVRTAEKEIIIRERAVRKAEAEIPKLRRKAMEDGKAEGLEDAETLIKVEVDEQVDVALQPALAALQRQRQELDEEQQCGRTELRQLRAKLTKVLQLAEEERELAEEERERAEEERERAEKERADAEGSREHHEEAAGKYQRLNARLEPVVAWWEQRNPATKTGQQAQRNLAVIERIRQEAASIETGVSSPDPEIGG